MSRHRLFLSVPGVRAGRSNLDLLVLFPDPEPWMAGALCAQVDYDLFFPGKGGSTVEAKRICGSCDVRRECLAYARSHDGIKGIWGGTSERERMLMRPPATDAVARRAVQVQQLAAQGLSNRQISNQLGIRLNVVREDMKRVVNSELEAS